MQPLSKKLLALDIQLSSTIHSLRTFSEQFEVIDTGTLNLLNELLMVVDRLVTKATMAPEDGNESRRQSISKYFVHTQSDYRCLLCKGVINSKLLKCVMQHIEEHEMSRSDEQPTGTHYMEKGSLPVCRENLRKGAKRLLQQKVERFVAEKMSDALDDVAVDVCKDVEKVLGAHYPEVMCYRFGSRVLRTGNDKSDIDIFVDIGGTYDGKVKLDRDQLKATVEIVENILEDSGSWGGSNACVEARVPVLRIRNLERKVDCDLTFSNGLAHRNTQWIRYMFDLQPTCRALAFYLKHWNQEPLLNNYTLTLMAIFYFQVRKLLPSVEQLQQCSRRRLLINGWDASFMTPSLPELGITIDVPSIKHIVDGFFQFYSGKTEQFSIETDVVCPFLGQTGLRKIRFSRTIEDIPEEMFRLREHLQQVGDGPDARKTDLFLHYRPMVVQDPFELSHNVAKAIAPAKAAQFIRYCQLSSG